MSDARVFVAGTHTRGDVVRIDGNDAHHVLHVLRLAAGDRIEVIDSAAQAFCAELTRDGNTLGARLLEQRSRALTPQLRIDVAQAVPKGSKMDFIVEKATELGVHTIIPFTSERTIVHSASDSRLERWRRLARSSAGQCGRSDIPSITMPIDFAELVTRFCAYDVVLFPWELADPVPLRERLPKLVERAQSLLLVIGPEGGFAVAEVELARANGADVISLGQRILRTETAALALLAILEYAMADKRNGEHARRINSD